jgi:hypothetical protein
MIIHLGGRRLSNHAAVLATIIILFTDLIDTLSPPR